MTTDKQSAVMPELRFPEFGNMPGWEPTQISDVLDYEQPGRYIVEDTNYQNAGTPVLTANKAFVLGHTTETDGIYQHVPVIIFDDFTTDAKYVDFPFKVKSSAIKILRARGEDELRLVHELMSRIRFDSTQHKRYFISQYQYLKIPLPGKSEQKKITDCLDSLDDMVAAEGRKLEALRQHKKGLIQKLFPRPGETVPRLRFPDFQNAGAWDEKELGDLASRGTGHTPKKAVAEYYNGGIKWVSLADSKRLDNGLISETDIEISEEGVNNSSAVLHPAGSVILSRDAGVGKSAILGCPMAVSQHFIVWICKPTVLSNWFLYYQLQLLKPFFEQIATGSTIKTIGLPFFNAMRVTVPRLAEQHRIADCLSMLDVRLAAQVQKLDALQTHKHGLLQQLFPALESR